MKREVDTLSSHKNKFYTLKREIVRRDLVITHSSHDGIMTKKTEEQETHSGAVWLHFIRSGQVML